jgi:hypothetical protein
MFAQDRFACRAMACPGGPAGAGGESPNLTFLPADFVAGVAGAAGESLPPGHPT